MSIFKKIIIMTVLFTIPTFASQAAGLFVEPLVSYENGNSSIDYPSPFSNSSGSIDGFGIGARLGVEFGGVIFLGADGRYMKPRFKDSTNNIDVDSTGYNYGVVLGVQTPVIGLRVWGTYILGGQLDPEEGNSVDLKFTDAKGYRVGAGFRLAIVSLNVEYQDLKYDTTTLQQLGPFSGNAADNISLTDKAWIFSVSFPFSI